MSRDGASHAKLQSPLGSERRTYPPPTRRKMKEQSTSVPTPARPRSEKEWQGFHFAAYSLVIEKVWDLPLARKRPSGGNTEKIQTTVGEIYLSLANCHIEIEYWGGCDMTITTETEELVLEGMPFHRDVLNALLRLRSDGVDPFAADWFWYDRDSVRDTPQCSYSFFVVHNDRIVRENISFSDYDSYDYARFGFDPSIFRVGDNSKLIWRNDTAWEDARIRFWYRKFYTETLRGRLMVLRDDEPALYENQYHRGAITTDILSRIFPIFLKLLSKIHVLLWVLIVLGVLILVRLWR
jgi:hypothetical protein